VNVFALHDHPILAATAQCDQHVVKMPTETAQILSTVADLLGLHTDAMYKPTHQRHPVVLWAASDPSNWSWLIEHGRALCDEYTDRYSKTHAALRIIERCAEVLPRVPFERHTSFAQAMPDCFRHSNPVVAYRRYYRGDKSSFARWRHSSRPLWW